MKKYLARTIFAILGAALVLLPLMPGGQGERFPAPEGLDFTKEIRWRYATDENGEYELCFLTAEREICRLPVNNDTRNRSPDFTLTRSAAAVISGYTENEGGKLYLVDGDGAALIAERAVHALISDDGNTIMYLQLSADGSVDILLYSHDSRETLTIAEGASLHNTARYALSPDGNTAAYCLDEGSGFTGMVWNSGEYHELGLGVFPIAVADGMTHLYYARPNGPEAGRYSAYSFYVKSGDTETYLLSSYDGASPRFNRDFTEVYLDGVWSGTPAVIACGADHVARLSGHIGPFADPYINYYSEYQCNPNYAYNVSYIRYCIRSFRGQPVCRSDDMSGAVAVIDEDMSFTEVKPSGLARYQISADGKTALYCATPFLYRTGGRGDNELLIKTVKNFVASYDLSEVYYITLLEGDLYYQDLGSGAEARFIAADAGLLSMKPYYSEINAESWPSFPYPKGVFLGDTLYFTTNGGRTLNMTRGGSSRELLSVEDGYFVFSLVGEKPFVTHRLMAGDTSVDLNCYSINGARLRLVSSDKYD